MKEFNFKQYLSGSKINMVSFFFWSFIILFFADRVANFFVHIPVFVVGGITLFPLLFVVTQIRNQEKQQLYVLAVSFILLAIINNIVFLFCIKNISDVLFIILFFTIYFFYKYNRDKIRFIYVYLFLGMSLLLFSFTFSGNNSTSVFSQGSKQVSVINCEVETDMVKKTPNSAIKFDSNKKLDYLETIRKYHYGMFRIPHVASYFFGFLTLLFLYMYQKNKKWHHLVMAGILLLACLYTGTRAILATITLSAMLFLFQRKYLSYLLGLSILIVVLFMANDYFLKLTKHTFLFQYFSFIKTLSYNVTRLSRFRIWYSWYIEIKQFNLLELIIGKSYINALLANQQNLNYSVWFHNDFLNIFYSYGVIGFGLYVGFIVKIYRDFKVLIRRNFFLFVFYVSMVILAFVNGFYYYFPIFILYLFFFMIQNEERYVR